MDYMQMVLQDLKNRKKEEKNNKMVDMKVFGIVDSLEKKETSKGDPLWKIKIDGKTYNWFIADVEFSIGDYVEGIFYEADNLKYPQFPYKNIKELAKTDKPTDYVQPEKKELTHSNTGATNPDVYELGMANKNAAIIIAGMLHTAKNPDEALEKLTEWQQADIYDKLVVAMFNKGKKIRSELLRS